jgi:hypothetical protein
MISWFEDCKTHCICFHVNWREQVNGRQYMGVFRLRKLIPVRYTDGHVDKIPSPLLNTLIETHKITEFKRKKGWVVVGSDAIRGMDHGQLRGKERRWN